ncbi:MAG: Sec-independent protein translocase subunit TatA/TatB [Chitinophagaceae bacterium]
MFISYFAKGELLELSIEHIILISIIVLLLFGGKKIPELMRGLGSGMREFNDAKNNVKQEIQNGINQQQANNVNNAANTNNNAASSTPTTTTTPPMNP